jgi:uncharacterized protein YjlB
MALLEQPKKSAERTTTRPQSAADHVSALLRTTTPRLYRFGDDGMIPNHPYWPVVVYRRAIRLPRALDAATVFEELFEDNKWRGSWRGEIYDFLHYHSRIHEALGIARGSAKVRVGGNGGRILNLSAGDVVVLPAGTGHQCLSCTQGFLAIGANPPAGIYDECGPSPEEHARSVKRVRKVSPPRHDPVFGSVGPLLKFWKADL